METIYVEILQRAAEIGGTTLRDPDDANLCHVPLFDDGTPEGKRIPIGIKRIDDQILWFKEGSSEREKAIFALGHFIERELKK